MYKKTNSERLSNIENPFSLPLTQETKDQMSKIDYGSVAGEKWKKRANQCMADEFKASPKPWQLVAFIFARPFAFVVIVMSIFGVLFATNVSVFKSTHSILLINVVTFNFYR
ncbi:hypothetical protein [Vibrio splendidus]|uniref:hypothetical protein n=1 Tax=Vibrio splendidus TaxID=29497 RepID=UPI003D125B8E